MTTWRGGSATASRGGRGGRRAAAVTRAPPPPAGVELSIGMTRDPAFGPIVVLAAGGIYVELFEDRGVALPPVAETAVWRLVDRLRCRRLLDGARGRPPADTSAVVTAVV